MRVHNICQSQIDPMSMVLVITSMILVSKCILDHGKSALNLHCVSSCYNQYVALGFSLCQWKGYKINLS